MGIGGTLKLLNVETYSEVIRQVFKFRQVYTEKRAACRVKRTKKLGRRYKYLDCSFSAMLSPKWLPVEQNGQKNGSLGQVYLGNVRL